MLWKKLFSQKAELEKQHQERMQELEITRQKFENQMSEFVKGSRDARKFQIEREELERQIEELRTERDKKLDKAIKKQLKTARLYIESIFESLEKDSRAQAIKSINDKEEQLTKMALDILEGEIREELEVKTKKLESLKSKVALAEQGKNERLLKIDEAYSALSDLVEKAEAVHAAIDSTETDIIKEQ